MLRGQPIGGNQDDVWVAWITGIPESLALLPGITCLLLTYWFLVTAIPRDRRLKVFVPCSAASRWVASCGCFGWALCFFREDQPGRVGHHHRHFVGIKPPYSCMRSRTTY